MPALRYFSGRLWASWVYRNRIQTILYDGSSILTQVGPELDDISRTRGYSDSYAFMVEKDLLHNWLAETIDNAPSPLMWARAHSIIGEQTRIKNLVGALQQALNCQEEGFKFLCQELGSHAQPLKSHAEKLLRPWGQIMDSQWAATENPVKILPKGWTS